MSLKIDCILYVNILNIFLKWTHLKIVSNKQCSVTFIGNRFMCCYKVVSIDNKFKKIPQKQKTQKKNVYFTCLINS